MTDPKIEDRSGEMEEDLHELEDHITEAEKKVEARKSDAAGFEDDTPADEREDEESAGPS